MEHAELMNLLTVLRDFESTSKSLQQAEDKTLNLYESRYLFDALIAKYDHLHELSQLKPNSDLVCSPHFENGIIKIQRGLDTHNKLSVCERNAVKRYKKTDSVDDDSLLNNDVNNSPNPAAMSFAESALAEVQRGKKRKQDDRRSQETESPKYRCTHHVLSQSNLCERLFSLAKLIMSDRRQSMHPSTLNNLLLLKTNRHLWDISDVQNILNDIGEGEPDIVLSDNEDDAEQQQQDTTVEQDSDEEEEGDGDKED
jgi:hypothetical protein